MKVRELMEKRPIIPGNDGPRIIDWQDRNAEMRGAPAVTEKKAGSKLIMGSKKRPRQKADEGRNT